MTKKIAIIASIVSLFFFQASISFADDALENIRSEGFTINPTDPNGVNPRKFIFELKPGEEKKDSVTIQHLADEDSTFSLYGADPTFSAQGTPAYKTRQAGGDGEGQWITFDEPEVVLGHNEERTISFTINVPTETELGEYRAGIAMEKTKKDINNPNITIATRVILHADIKVTENPQPVPKKGESYPSAEETQGPWQIYYFWISLILFIGSFIALIWVTFKEKNQPLQTIQTSAVIDTAEKKKAARRVAAAKRGKAKAKSTKKNASKTRSTKKTVTKKSASKAKAKSPRRTTKKRK